MFGRNGGGGGYCGWGGRGGPGGMGGCGGWGWGANGADGWGGGGGGGGWDGGCGGNGGNGGGGGSGGGGGGRGGHGGYGFGWRFPGVGHRLGGGGHGRFHFRGPGRQGCSRRFRCSPPFATFFAPDVEDWGSEYRIVSQVRGLTGDDIALEIRGSELGVRADSGEESSRLHFRVQIPADVEREFILAEVNSNVLTIVLPKAEPMVVTVETVVDPPEAQEQMEAESERSDVEPERRPPTVADLEDWGCEYRFTQDAQGLSLDDIDVQVRDGQLLVGFQDGAQLKAVVPPDVVVDGVHAEMDDTGVVTVVLPKSQGRFIPVSVAGAAPAAPSAPPADEGPSGMTDVVERTEVITLSDTEADRQDREDGNDASMEEYDEHEGWVDVDGAPPQV